MGINIADNFAYNGKKPMDNRTEYTTLAAMKAVVDANINEGCICYNKEDGKYYTFKSTNTVDATTGKWREFETGGGGQTYNDFTGATASAAGAHGLVPAPSAGDEDKVLFGNGAWGALPSVDLSVLSNEAFQFSPNEKPVGTWTDGNNVTKLVYARTFFGSGTLTLPKLVFTNVSTYFGVDVSNMAKIVNSILLNNGGTSHLVPLHCDIYQSALQLYYDGVVQDTLSDGILTLFYTKTTDSPLPSGVKFAGVTSDGKVILKKLYTGLNFSPTQYVWSNTGINIPNCDKVLKCEFAQADNDSTNFINVALCKINSNKDLSAWFTIPNYTYDKALVYYTLAS